MKVKGISVGMYYMGGASIFNKKKKDKPWFMREMGYVSRCKSLIHSSSSLQSNSREE